MLTLSGNTSGEALRVLCLGAHCDDIEIGCGATIRKLILSGQRVEIFWNVFSSNPVRKVEAENSAEKFTRDAASINVEINNFRNGYFPSISAEIKDYFEILKRRFEPDVVFTHFAKDAHQDHRTVSELTWNTFRNHWILEYEIPKYDGDLGTPNFFSEISAEISDFKIATIMECFASQSDKNWFDRTTFTSLMRLRGMECNAGSTFAEAFYVRKSILEC
jgi:LmbE family N-acetylglucosaminyl deacetylase